MSSLGFKALKADYLAFTLGAIGFDGKVDRDHHEKLASLSDPDVTPLHFSCG
jgi:hypothetical protein